MITLSILIITHNQLPLLKRCLGSVLAQQINVPFEVIISDDRSIDGTDEYIHSLSSNIKALNVKNLEEIVYTRCNSDKCDPSNASERCGWNKLNAYSYARGDFFVNIDADDYLKSTDIYQCQLDALIAHPECSMCMQDVWQVKDGDIVDNGKCWPSFGKLCDGQVLSVKEIVADYRALNQCYMIRRHPEFDVANHYGKFFDDTIITLHHLQFGSCVFVNRADYVWVTHEDSITGALSGDDAFVTYSLLPLHHILYINKFSGLFMLDSIQDLVHFYKILFEKKFTLKLSESSKIGIGKETGFIYEKLVGGFSLIDKVKVLYIRLLLLLSNRFHLSSPMLLRYLYYLNTNYERASSIEFKCWQIG